MTLRAVALLLLVVAASAAEPQHWHSGDEGTGVDEILTTWPLRDPEPVVVAVLDSGFDLDHPALEPALWVNPAEAAGTAGVDDDGNGFVDDLHGWSFLCSSAGEDLIAARMEVTRLHAALLAEVEAGERGRDDPLWREISRAFERQRDSWRWRLERSYMFAALRDRAQADLSDAGIEVDPDDPQALQAAEAEAGSWLARAALGVLVDLTQSPGAHRLLEEAQTQLEYCYNPEFDESVVLGDVPGDPAPVGYGGHRLSVGWRDGHGTMVATIIAGVPWEAEGTRGLCPGARLMLLRTTPHGDERDKDVASGIRYAVANGARVINMSFGKPYSPQKEWVDAAMAEAEAAGVLVVHAAGNDGSEVLADNTFPSPHHAGGRFANWLVVGASQRDTGSGPFAAFSNWSPTEVDLFAPGHQIRGPTRAGGVDTNSGTSLAAPCVSGVAALLWSQFPAATVDQVKAAILAGARPVAGEHELPGRQHGPATAVCASGGLLDARLALAALARELGDESILPERLRTQAGVESP